MSSPAPRMASNEGVVEAVKAAIGGAFVDVKDSVGEISVTVTRDGLLAAMVLSLAGVDDDAIVADYLASASAMPRIIERFRDWPRYRDHMTRTPPEVYAVE